MTSTVSASVTTMRLQACCPRGARAIVWGNMCISRTLLARAFGRMIPTRCVQQRHKRLAALFEVEREMRTTYTYYSCSRYCEHSFPRRQCALDSWCRSTSQPLTLARFLVSGALIRCHQHHRASLSLIASVALLTKARALAKLPFHVVPKLNHFASSILRTIPLPITLHRLNFLHPPHPSHPLDDIPQRQHR